MAENLGKGLAFAYLGTCLVILGFDYAVTVNYAYLSNRLAELKRRKK